ncbi:MAG: hypothetical protein WDZ93_00725 [Candidatus Paceibacterota bacterium]
MQDHDHFLYDVARMQSLHRATLGTSLEKQGNNLLNGERPWEGHYFLALHHYRSYRYWSQVRPQFYRQRRQIRSNVRYHLAAAKRHARTTLRALINSHPRGLNGFCDMYQHALAVVLLRNSRKWWWGPGKLVTKLLKSVQLEYGKAYSTVNN